MHRAPVRHGMRRRHAGAGYGRRYWVRDVGRGNEFLVTDLMKVSPSLDGFGIDISGQRALISVFRRLRRLFRHEP